MVKKHGAEHAAKGFGCWTQFVAMLFCQLGRADSLREICNGLACCLGRLVHLGISKAPSRSTLSYANEHRPAALFEDLFWTALARFRDQQGLGSRQHKFRFKNKLLSLDSTTISLCLTMFPWAQFRRAKGGVKAHVLLDHDDYLPAYVLLTEAKRSDVRLADSFSLNAGSIVTMDRGYTDYALFGRWTLAGVFFVTRLKDNAVFTVETEFEVLFRFSVKWRGSVPPLVSVPPLRGGDFQGIRVYRSDVCWGRARKANFRARHRLNEPAKLSLGLVASLQWDTRPTVWTIRQGTRRARAASAMLRASGASAVKTAGSLVLSQARPAVWFWAQC